MDSIPREPWLCSPGNTTLLLLGSMILASHSRKSIIHVPHSWGSMVLPFLRSIIPTSHSWESMIPSSHSWGSMIPTPHSWRYHFLFYWLSYILYNSYSLIFGFLFYQKRKSSSCFSLFLFLYKPSFTPFTHLVEFQTFGFCFTWWVSLLFSLFLAISMSYNYENNSTLFTIITLKMMMVIVTYPLTTYTLS